MRARQAWTAKVNGVDPRRLVFLDETGAKTNMTRVFARSKKGLRAVDYAPLGRWTTTTLVAGMTLESAIAPFALEGPMDRQAFETYIEQVLIPSLPPKAIVVMDNLSAHKSHAVAEMLERTGASLWYLPPYSPDLNPIEQMWSKVKAHLRSAKARTEDELYNAIASALARITPADTKGFFLGISYV